MGSSDECRNLDSMKLGCVRLSNLFFDDGEKPVSPKRYAALQNYIRNSALHSFQRIADFTLTEAVGSSGTAQNLAEISAALDEADALRQGRKPVERRDLLSYAGLCRVVRELCSRTLKERKALPGINANRADVIIAGAAILQTIMEDQGFDSVRISNRNLQNGLLVDYITRRRPHKEGSFHPVRKESVLHLARKCGYEERHSRHVARLALDLFDSARALGLHALSPDLRELLHYAGLLHDIGIFISFSRHNVHSHYLIRNTELLGFTAREVELLAALAYFHRKRPTRKTPFYTELDDDMRAEVRPLSLFLLLAERMDKSHRQIIRAARFVQGDDGLLLLRSRFLVGNGLLRDGILAGQGLVTAQVQLLIGQVGFGLGLGRFGLGQGSVISPAVEAEQRLAFRDFLTALDVFLHDAAGNLRPDGHFVRRRDGTAVLGLDRRVCGDDFIRVDGNRGLGRTLLGTTAGQERGNGENGDAHRRKFAFLYHLHFPPISFDS